MMIDQPMSLCSKVSAVVNDGAGWFLDCLAMARIISHSMMVLSVSISEYEVKGLCL